MMLLKKLLIPILMVSTMSAWAWQPSKPIEATVGFTPGSVNDLVIRLLSKQVKEQTQAEFSVINRPGAGGVVGTQKFQSSLPDGHHIIMLSLVGLTAMDLIAVPAPGPGYTINDFSHVQVSAISPFAVVAHVDDVVDNPKKFVSTLKSEKVTVSANGGARLVYELLRAAIKFQQGDGGVVRVEHKGPVNTLTDVAGGHVRFGIVPISVAMRFHQDKRVKIIAVSGSKSIPQLPTVKPISSVIPDFDVVASWGIALPKNTPAEIVSWYQDQFSKAIKKPETRKFYESNLLTVDDTLLTTQAATEFIKREEKKYAPLLQDLLKAAK